MAATAASRFRSFNTSSTGTARLRAPERVERAAFHASRADAAIAAGVSVYATSSIDELLATGDEAVVVALTPDGGVLGTWPLDEFDHDDLASALAD